MNAIVEVGFDYSLVEDGVRDHVRDAAVRIKVRMARTAADIVDIGRDLIEVKERLGHGHFLRWIEAEFGMTDRTARNFMRVAERFKSEIVSDFSPSVLYALAAPSTPDEVVEDVVKRSVDGETFTAADISQMKDDWAAEKKALKAEIDKHKSKAGDERATRSDAMDQVEQLRADLAALRDERETLRWQLENSDGDRSEDEQFGALMLAWERASAVVRERFRTAIGG